MYLHEWLNFMVNVGKYSSPMEHLEWESIENHTTNLLCSFVVKVLVHFG